MRTGRERHDLVHCVWHCTVMHTILRRDDNAVCELGHACGLLPRLEGVLWLDAVTAQSVISTGSDVTLQRCEYKREAYVLIITSRQNFLGSATPTTVVTTSSSEYPPLPSVQCIGAAARMHLGAVPAVRERKRRRSVLAGLLRQRAF